MCGDAGERGVVKSDGEGADDKGGQSEDNFEAVIVLSIAYVVEIGPFIPSENSVEPV